jgi:hypothetical protein
MITPPAAAAAAAAAPVAVSAALLGWRHRHGPLARCLVRVRVVPADQGRDQRAPDARGGEDLGGRGGGGVRTVVVVSELRGNPRGCEIGSDFAGLATAALAQVLPGRVAPSAVRWYAHHGEFSSYDPAGPSTLTRVPLRWDGERYQDPPLTAHELLDPPGYARVVAALRLEPVAEVLTRWGWNVDAPNAGGAGAGAAMRL